MCLHRSLGQSGCSMPFLCLVSSFVYWRRWDSHVGGTRQPVRQHNCWRHRPGQPCSFVQHADEGWIVCAGHTGFPSKEARSTLANLRAKWLEIHYCFNESGSTGLSSHFQCFKWAKMHTVHSAPTSRFHPLAYRDFFYAHWDLSQAPSSLSCPLYMWVSLGDS